jgi:hypothetical protein
MVKWRSQRWTLEEFLSREVPEPVFAGLVALHDRMLLGRGVPARVL